MASELAYLTVPRGLSREVTLYLQSLQKMVMELAGYRKAGKRAVRLAEAIAYINEGKALPEALAGTARHNETVRLGSYNGRPVVIVTGFDLDCSGKVSVHIRNLRPDKDDWLFEAECQCLREDAAIDGSLDYLAIGRRQKA